MARLNVWLITVGEPLPLPDNKDRLWRTGLLAQILSARGHEVLWWTSTMDHLHKRLFVQGEPVVSIGEGLTLQFLHGIRYHRNVSLARIRNHGQIARRFRIMAPKKARPDIILCSFPTIELSEEAARFGKAAGVPVVLDVRDLWPDIFLDVLPRPVRFLGRALLDGAFRSAAKALRVCDAVIGVSPGYLQWGLERGSRHRGADDGVYPLAYRLSPWSAEDEQALDAKLRSIGLNPEVPTLIFAGTFGRTYDLRTVIDAARLLSQRRAVKAQIVLCGRGDREVEWRALAAGIPGVGFVGWLEAGQLACLLSRSRIGLAAYAATAPQGVPNKVIEYLAASLPVLCSLPGEARELLESNGCGGYYTPGDAQQLAQQVEEIMGDDATQQVMRGASQKLFAARFSSESVYGALADHLEDLARRSSAS